MFVLTHNTGANMTIGVNSPVLTNLQVANWCIYDLNGNGSFDLPYLYGTLVNGVTECVGLAITEGFMGLALWGDDSSTNVKDGLGSVIRQNLQFFTMVTYFS